MLSWDTDIELVSCSIICNIWCLCHRLSTSRLIHGVSLPHSSTRASNSVLHSWKLLIVFVFAEI